MCDEFCQLTIRNNDFFVKPGDTCRTSAPSSITKDTPVCCEPNDSGRRLMESGFTSDMGMDYLGLSRRDNGNPDCVPCKDCDAPQMVDDDCCKAFGVTPGGRNNCGTGKMCCKCWDRTGYDDEFKCVSESEFESCDDACDKAPGGSEVCELETDCLFGDDNKKGVCCTVEANTQCTWCDECGTYLSFCD